MSVPPRGWRLLCGEGAAATLEAIRLEGEAELHREVVLFLQALTLEAGAAVDAEKPPPGLPMGDGRYNVDVPQLPILLSYTPYPQVRELRLTDLLWLG